jgi:hypothetical protein
MEEERKLPRRRGVARHPWPARRRLWWWQVTGRSKAKPARGSGLGGRRYFWGKFLLAIKKNLLLLMNQKIEFFFWSSVLFYIFLSLTLVL